MGEISGQRDVKVYNGRLMTSVELFCTAGSKYAALFTPGKDPTRVQMKEMVHKDVLN